MREKVRDSERGGSQIEEEKYRRVHGYNHRQDREYCYNKTKQKRAYEEERVNNW